MITENVSDTAVQLRALYHLSVELSALRSLGSVLKTALKHCLDLTGSQFGFIGLITAALTFAGMILGVRLGNRIGKRMILAGGIVLLIIGLKIVFDHTF